MRSTVSAILSAGLLLFWSAALSAGELVLNNGDRLKGRLGLIDKSNITWVSDSFGNLTISKNKVANLVVDKPVVIQVQRDTCVITGMENHYLAYRCGGSDFVQRTELLSLASVEPFVEKSEKSYEYGGQMSVSGVFSRGNTEEDDLDINASSTFRQGNFRHVTAVDVDTLRTGDSATTEDYELSYRLDWFFKEKWFWYNALSGGVEESKSVTEFYQYGTGLGVQMWENINTALALESGIDFKKERYENSASDDVEAGLWRFATRYR